MNLKDKLLIEEYRKSRNDFLRLSEIVNDKLHEMVEKCFIQVLAIEHRVKTEKSLEGKLLRKGDHYASLSDITDILGARVICLFNDDIDKIGHMVEKEFVIDTENSSDKRALMDAEAFGYLSLHYICSLKAEDGYGPELCGKKFEIQIRTGLQHIWAFMNHDIAYKSDFGVPREIRRGFSRLAGLLELADDEFVRVRDDMLGYTNSIREKIVSGNADDVPIDVISLNVYMLDNKQMRRFLDELAKIENSEVTQTDAQPYIEQLAFLSVNTVGDLEKMFLQNKELAFKLAQNALCGSELDILASNVALRFLCRAYLINSNADFETICSFMLMSNADKSKAERRAKRLLKTKESLNGKAEDKNE